MRKSFSARKYNQEEWQVVIVGLTADEKNMVRHYLQQISGVSDDSDEHTDLMKKPDKPKKKDWEE